MSIVADGRGRLEWADFARGAAILAVVYFHSTLFLAVVGVDNTFGRAKIAFELVPLPAFFLIAGIFGARIVLDGSFAELARERLIPLAYVYVLWSVLRFALFTVVPSLPSRDTDIAADDPMSLVMLPVLPASLYWFLYALAVFTLVVWTLRRVPRWVLVGGSAAVSTLFTTGILNTQTIAWNRIGALLFFFSVGVCFSREIVAAMRVAGGRQCGTLLIVYVAIIGMLFFFRAAARLPLVVLVGQCVGVAALLVGSKMLARIRPFTFVSQAGRQSLPIYLVHILVIPPLALLVGALGPDWPAVVNIAICVAVTAIAVLAGFALSPLAARAPWLLAPRLHLPRTVGLRPAGTAPAHTRARPGARERSVALDPGRRKDDDGPQASAS